MTAVGVGTFAVIHLPGGAEAVERRSVLHRLGLAAQPGADEDHLERIAVARMECDTDVAGARTGPDIDLEGTVAKVNTRGQGDSLVDPEAGLPLPRLEADAVGSLPTRWLGRDVDSLRRRRNRHDRCQHHAHYYLSLHRCLLRSIREGRGSGVQQRTGGPPHANGQGVRLINVEHAPIRAPTIDASFQIVRESSDVG